MPQIPCSSLDRFDLASLEGAIAARREWLLQGWALTAVLLLTTFAWAAYAFHYFPVQRAERFEVLNREKPEKLGPADTPNVSVPWHANRTFATIGVVAALIWTAVAIALTLRGRLPSVRHNPGPIEESVRPDYGRAQISVLDPRVVKLYFVRCQACGKTLKQWEVRG